MSKFGKPALTDQPALAAAADGARSFRESGVLGRAVRLLELIAESGPFRFSELQEQTTLPKATLHRLLSELADERLVHFDGQTHLYQAGFRVLELANHVWTRSDIRSLVGTQVPAYCTGIGKVLLAWCDAAQQESILSRISFARFTGNTITDLDALKHELMLVSERGYAIDGEEHFAGSSCIAAPIVDQYGRAVAGISITAPTFRTPLTQLEQWRESIVSAAAVISGRLAPSTARPISPAH